MHKRFNSELEKAKKTMSHHMPNLSASLQNLLNQAKKKFEEHKVKNEMDSAMHNLQQDLQSRIRNLAASSGMHVRDQKQVENMIRHLVYLHAQDNMRQAMAMQTAAQQLAAKYMGQSNIQAAHNLANGFTTMWHSYMRKYMEGTEAILKKHGVSIKKEHMLQALQHGLTEAMHGKSVMDAIMAVMKKNGVNTDGLDSAVKTDLMSHIQKLKTDAKTELQKLLHTHKVSSNVEQVVAAMLAKAKECLAKMKVMHAAVPKGLMTKLEHMSRKAFKNVKPEERRKIIMHMHLMIRPAMNSHFQLVARIFKNHKLGNNHSVIHYTIYHRIKDDCEECREHHHHHHHHHPWWRKHRLALIIGGSIFGAAVLVAALVVMVHTIRHQRNSPCSSKKKEVYGEEKSSLPYSVMGENGCTKA